MNQEVEIEYKNLLTSTEYTKISQRYPFPKEADSQTNYYFETDNFLLKENGSALRIRKKHGNYVLTLKEPHPHGLLETHDALTEEEATDWINGNIVQKDHVMKRLQALHIPINKLVYYGKLTTERREVEHDNALLVLDYSMYNQTSDYELEVEAPTEEIGIRVFTDVLENNQVEKRDTPNKIKRFFATLPK
ncbi:CYTH domain-containing protein [Lentibacillus sp. Marseille-P4043]|uniref:CYTH domain-containing protein n=1 Tax=Lentibacillus sp. Marseille-P4043 TaxID=2040293 RepID=UPI000D0ABCDD|nr:CYTH domain-containing protein [Lentibacillus sp. Marseille-P4043]